MKILMLTFCSLFTVAANSQQLTLNEFLDEVTKSNQGYTSTQKSTEAGQLKSEEGDLMLAYTFFMNYQNSNDKRESNFAFVTGDRVTNNTMMFGFKKLTSFGLSASLYYDISYTYMHGANTSFLNADHFYETSPVLDLSLSLWKNGFGRQTRAMVEATDAKNLSSSYAASYNSRKILSDAESIYWKVSLVKDLVNIKKDNLDRAKKIKEWAERRTKLNLADKVDLLQAQANYKMAEMDLQAAMDDEKEATRVFNTMRGINSDEFNGQTEKLTVDSVVSIPLPERKGVRDDVASLREAARAAAANAKLSKDNNRPTFDIFSSLSLNGRDPNFDPSFKESWRGNFPYTVVGVKFSTPLDFGSRSRVNSGYDLDKIAAEYMYERKNFESDREWDNLTKKVNDMKERLKIAKELEDAQYKKYSYEQNRLKLGRTTTYQVITFEQDYANAQYVRLGLQLQILQMIANMKTFEGKEVEKI